jgi:hypothetical protein
MYTYAVWQCSRRFMWSVSSVCLNSRRMMSWKLSISTKVLISRSGHRRLLNYAYIEIRINALWKSNSLTLTPYSKKSITSWLIQANLMATVLFTIQKWFWRSNLSLLMTELTILLLKKGNESKLYWLILDFWRHCYSSNSSQLKLEYYIMSRLVTLITFSKKLTTIPSRSYSPTFLVSIQLNTLHCNRWW